MQATNLELSVIHLDVSVVLGACAVPSSHRETLVIYCDFVCPCGLRCVYVRACVHVCIYNEYDERGSSCSMVYSFVICYCVNF